MLEFERASNMVNVGVSHKNLLEPEPQIGDASKDAADLVAGIDDDGFSGFFVAEKSAVALQRPDDKCFEDHAHIVMP